MRTLLNTLIALLIIAIVVAAVWALGMIDGDVTIALPDIYGLGQAYDITISLRALVIALLVFIVLVTLVAQGIATLARMPSLWKSKRNRAAQEKGLQALTRGLVAIAAGDAVAAKKQAAIAAKHLAKDRNGPALAMLLSAQSAELSGDLVEAAAIYQKLAQDPDAGFLGVRGQLQRILPGALKSGDNSAASLLVAAQSHAPNSAFVLNARLALAARQERWNDAKDIVKQMDKAKAASRTLLRRHETAVWLGLSRNENEHGLDYANKAFQLDPEFTPSALRAAELYIAENDKKSAARVLEKSWRLNPHPQIIKWWERAAPNDKADKKMAPLDLYQWTEKLTRLRPEHAESRLALGLSGLRAGLWGEARQNLISLHEDNLTDARTYRALAELETAQYANRAASDAWKDKAHIAKPEPLWVCEECGQTHRNWQPVCPNCGTFDQMEWKVPSTNIPMLMAPVN